MEGPPPQEEDFSKLPIQDRISHKNWKARVSAYEELVKIFRTTIEEGAPEFAPYTRDDGATLRAAILDANAVAQEKGIECACALVEFGGKSAAARVRDSFVSALAEKGLWGATRAGTKKAAVELCLLLVECEESANGILPGCIDGLKSKQPKAVAGAVNTMKELVKQFGPSIIDVKPILKSITTIFAHADKTVRAEGTSLVQELHRYIGSAIDPYLTDLKPVQIKELNDSFANEEKGVQTRFTRKQQRERAVKEAEASLSGNSKSKNEEINEGVGADDDEEVDDKADVYDFTEPMPVLDKLPPEFYDKLSSAKWKERKEEALDPLLETLRKYSKLADGNYDELVKALAGRMTDANITCVIAAAGCLEQLAKGLRSSFARYKTVCMSPLLERCKEKKQSVTDALANALDAIFQSINISDIVEDVVTFSKHKNPQVKEQTYKFLVRSLATTKVAPSFKSDFKPLSDCLVAGLEDSFEPVRTAAAEGLGTLQKVVGDRAMTQVLESLDDIRKAKVKDFAQKAQVKYRAGGARPAGAPVKPTSSSAPAPPGLNMAKLPPRLAAAMKAKTASGSPQKDIEKENTPPSVSSPAKPARAVVNTAEKGEPANVTTKPAIRKPPILSSSSTKAITSAAPVKALPAHKPTSNEPLQYRFTQEDAESQAEALLPAEIMTDLSNANWKIRNAAMEALGTWLSDGEGQNVDGELVVRLLSKRPGWKESNFQVYGKMANIFQQMSESPKWSKAASALTIPSFCDKLGDIKLKKPVGDALVAYAEKFSLQFVLGHAYEPMTKQKAPKVQADALTWLEQTVREFGVEGIVIRDLIEFLKVGLKSSNAAVRTNATKTLVTLRLYVGPDITIFLQDLNPTLLSTIDTEFGKVDGEQPPSPTRKSADLIASKSIAGSSGKGSKDPKAALDELFPRQDLEKLIPHSVVAACNDANWKNRKEALEQVQSILEANKRLKPGIGVSLNFLMKDDELTASPGDLSTALKLRMADSNKVVQALALNVISQIAQGMNKPFEKHARVLIGPIAAILSDSKPNVRAPALATLTAVQENCGLDCMLAGLATSLETTNPMQRKEIASWLVDRLQADSKKGDLGVLVEPTVVCLEDRNMEVRKAMQALLPYLVQSVGYQRVLDSTNSLKPASRSTVIPMIESARAGVPAEHPEEDEVITSSRQTYKATATSRPPSSAATSRPPSQASNSVLQKPVATVRALSATSRSLKPSGSSISAAGTQQNTAADLNYNIRPTQQSRAAPRQSVTPTIVANESPIAEDVPEMPFRTADVRAKQSRASRETGPLKWHIDGIPRADQIDFLQHQMAPHASAQLIKLLFSKDHHSERDFLSGMNYILDNLPSAEPEQDAGRLGDPAEYVSRYIANSDLILKYATIRLADSATTLTLKSLELIDMIVKVMLGDGQHLSDYEAGIFLPSLVVKMGDGKEPIRLRVKAILKALGTIYPSSKIFSSLLDHGLRSKNARTRSETLDELGSLIQRQGMSVCVPGKALPVIASMISDKDAACRTAALTAIGNAHNLIGEEVYKLIGPLADKERSMLDEKLKRMTPIPPSPSLSRSQGIPTAGTPGRPDHRPDSAHTDGRSAIARPSGISRLPGASIKRRISGLPLPGSALTMPRVSSHSSQASSGPTQQTTSSLDQHITDIQPTRHSSSVSDYGTLSTGYVSPFSGILTVDVNLSVDALKSVQQTIAEDQESLVSNADLLVETLAKQIAVGFDGLSANTPQPTLRLCKHLMQTLSSFFDQRALSLAVHRSALTMILKELTTRLLETADSGASEAIVSLSKVLNMVLIRIFHNSTRSSCFGALFTILQASTLSLRELDGQVLAAQAKYAELVMKCLWKISKSVKESIDDKTLDAQQLLLDIDLFLQAIPPAEWRRRSTDNIPLGDMPLRTVKTILQQVVGAYGENVYNELALIDRPESSFVYQYLFRLLNNARPVASDPHQLQTGSAQIDGLPKEASRREPSGIRHSPSQKEEKPTPASASSERYTSRHLASLPAPGRSNDIEINLALKNIFDKIGNAQESKRGIAELYEFQKQHPEAEARINTWITATGSFFQSYLKRALSNLAAEEAERSGQSLSGPSLPTARASASPGPELASTETSPSKGRTRTPSSPARSQEKTSRVLSGSSSVANDDRLDSLKQLFGMPARNSVAG